MPDKLIANVNLKLTYFNVLINVQCIRLMTLFGAVIYLLQKMFHVWDDIYIRYKQDLIVLIFTMVWFFLTAISFRMRIYYIFYIIIHCRWPTVITLITPHSPVTHLKIFLLMNMSWAYSIDPLYKIIRQCRLVRSYFS